MRSVRRLAQQIQRLAHRHGETAAAEMQRAYRRLLAVAHQSQRQAVRVRAALGAVAGTAAARLVAQLDQVLPRVAQAIAHAKRRVLQKEAAPTTEKLVRLFEPHTQVIQRRKPGKAVEFGRKLWLEEVEGGIISRYRLLADVGQAYPHLVGSLADHQRRFGHPPWLLAGDRGGDTPTNEALAKQVGVTRVVLPHVGKASPERVRLDRQRWFRRGFRFRAGIEGRISVRRRCYGLDRCREHSADGMGRWVGWGIVTANLETTARTVAQRAAAPTT